MSKFIGFGGPTIADDGAVLFNQWREHPVENPLEFPPSTLSSQEAYEKALREGYKSKTGITEIDTMLDMFLGFGGPPIVELYNRLREQGNVPGSNPEEFEYRFQSGSVVDVYFIPKKGWYVLSSPNFPGIVEIGNMELGEGEAMRMNISYNPYVKNVSSVITRLCE